VKSKLLILMIVLSLMICVMIPPKKTYALGPAVIPVVAGVSSVSVAELILLLVAVYGTEVLHIGGTMTEAQQEEASAWAVNLVENANSTIMNSWNNNASWILPNSTDINQIYIPVDVKSYIENSLNGGLLTSSGIDSGISTKTITGVSSAPTVTISGITKKIIYQYDEWQGFKTLADPHTVQNDFYITKYVYNINSIWTSGASSTMDYFQDIAGLVSGVMTAGASMQISPQLQRNDLVRTELTTPIQQITDIFSLQAYTNEQIKDAWNSCCSHPNVVKYKNIKFFGLTTSTGGNVINSKYSIPLSIALPSPTLDGTDLTIPTTGVTSNIPWIDTPTGVRPIDTTTGAISGVGIGTNTFPLTVAQDIAGIRTGVETLTKTTTESSENTVDKFKLMVSTKFPFSLPWDLMAALAVLTADPITPDIALDTNVGQMPIKFDISFSFLDPYINFFRQFEIIAFCLFLILTTRKLMGGAS
jgi:hypothetical protein